MTIRSYSYIGIDNTVFLDFSKGFYSWNLFKCPPNFHQNSLFPIWGFQVWACLWHPKNAPQSFWNFCWRFGNIAEWEVQWFFILLIFMGCSHDMLILFGNVLNCAYFSTVFKMSFLKLANAMCVSTFQS